MDYIESTKQQLAESGRSPKTANSYISHLRRLVSHFGEETGNLEPEALRGYRRYVWDGCEGRRRPGGSCAEPAAWSI